MGAARLLDDLGRLALEATSDAVYLLDREWRFRYVNEVAARLLRRDDLVGTVVWEEFPPAADSSIGRSFRRAVATGEPVDLEEHYEPLDTWFEIRAFPAEWGLAVFFRDVDDRRRAAAERAAAAELTAATLNALPSPTVVLDEDGAIVRTNRAWDLHEAVHGTGLRAGARYLAGAGVPGSLVPPATPARWRPSGPRPTAPAPTP